MAILRCITAEEEAAAAILLTLKQQSYENAGALNFKSHVHKQALFPFVFAVVQFLRGVRNIPFKPRVRVQTSGAQRKARVELIFADGTVALPEPPLHFSITLPNGQPYYFERELAEVARQAGKGSVLEAVREGAKIRNRILYANEQGRGIVTGDIPKQFVSYKDRVFSLLTVFALMFPYPQRALFVQQTLNAFLVVLDKLSSDTTIRDSYYAV